MTRRRIVLQLADDTTDTHCGSCGRRRRFVCEAFDAAWLDRDAASSVLRHDDCRSAELRPETVEALWYARKCLSALAHANDRAAAAHAALADFERLFGGET